MHVRSVKRQNARYQQEAALTYLLEACSLSELLHIHIEEDTLILTCRQLCQHKWQESRSWGSGGGRSLIKLRELPMVGLMFQNPANQGLEFRV